jgi:acyl dehydratase
MAPTEPRTLDSVEFQVEAGKVREFATATFARDAVHTDPDAARAAGFGSLLATPTYTVVAGHYRDQRAMVRALGLDLSRIVVGSTSWHYARPLVVGDQLRGTRRVVADEQREGKRGGAMRLITLETEYVDETGAAAARVREMIIERGAQA